MINSYELDDEDKFEFPYKCPICKSDLSPDENMDFEVKDNKYRTIVRCGNKGCKYSKILYEEMI